MFTFILLMIFAVRVVPVLIDEMCLLDDCPSVEYKLEYTYLFDEFRLFRRKCIRKGFFHL